MKDWLDYVSENDAALHSIEEKLVSDFFQVLKSTRSLGGKVWVLGNGGSASTASHAVVDFCKTSKSSGAQPLMTIAPSEMMALQTAYSNDVSFETGMASTIADFGSEKDAVWIISVSGKSPNLIAAFDEARRIGMQILSTVGLTGRDLAAQSDVGIVIDSADYQVVENVHLILLHWFTKLLSKNP